MAETGELVPEVEIDFLVPHVDCGRGDDELGAEAFAFGVDSLELGLDAAQSGIERELEDLLSGKPSEGLITAIQNRVLEVLTEPKLDRHVEASSQGVSISGSEEEQTHDAYHDPALVYEYNMNKRWQLG